MSVPLQRDWITESYIVIYSTFYIRTSFGQYDAGILLFLLIILSNSRNFSLHWNLISLLETWIFFFGEQNHVFNEISFSICKNKVPAPFNSLPIVSRTQTVFSLYRSPHKCHWPKSFVSPFDRVITLERNNNGSQGSRGSRFSSDFSFEIRYQERERWWRARV